MPLAAQTSPAPSPAVVALARNAMQSISGILPPVQPDHQTISVLYEPDYISWELSWDTQRDQVTVDENLLKIIKYSSFYSYEQAKAANAAGQQPAITREQALNKVSSTGILLGKEQGDWRLDEANLVTPFGGVPPYYWEIRNLRYIENWPVNDGGEFAYINAYDGSVRSWDVTYSTYVPLTNSSIYPETQARITAINAFQHGSACVYPAPVLVNNGPTWERISSNSSLHALAYVYEFKTSTCGVEAVVDAQTGELWRVECVTEGSTSGLNLSKTNSKTKSIPKPSRRFTLASTLLAVNKSSGLGRAMVAGKPLKKASISKASKQFTWVVDERSVDFSMNAKTRTLAWKDGSKTWSGVTLKAEEAAKLADWMKANSL